jgi:hypothetical protein
MPALVLFRRLPLETGMLFSAFPASGGFFGLNLVNSG